MEIRKIELKKEQPQLLALARRFAAFPLPDYLEATRFEDRQATAMLADLAAGNSQFIGSYEKERLLAFAEFHEQEHWATGEKILYLSRLVVDKAWEGQGIGRQLIAYVENYAKTQGYPRLKLNVFENNHKAVAWYEGLGFTTESRSMLKEL